MTEASGMEITLKEDIEERGQVSGMGRYLDS